MDEYYKRIQDKLLIQEEMIDALLKKKNQKVRSDYYEAIIRDLVRENVPQAFSVSRGIILNEDGESSEECDLILYESSSFDTWFQSGEILVVSPEAVRAVIEIKRTLTVGSINDAIKNIKHINNLRSDIFKFIVGFNTNTPYYELVRKCIQSRIVNSMFVFNTNKSQDKQQIESEMKRFMNIIKRITATNLYAGYSAQEYYIHNVLDRVVEDTKIEELKTIYVKAENDYGEMFVVTPFD